MIDFKKLKFVTQKEDKDTPMAAQQQQMAANDVSISSKFDEIVAAALGAGANEIHIEPFIDRTRIRTRVKNQLVEHEPLEKKMHDNMVNRIKVLSGMDITKRGIAQTGYFQVDLEERKVDLVAIIVPTSAGNKAFIKIHYTQSLGLGLEQLGMYPKVLEEFKKLLQRPNGLILVAGPPGSGRTTTCYSCLQHLNSPEKNVCTFENTIRYQIAGVIQGKPEERYNYTFIDGLKATLDQEPDLLFVGDLNDDEAARLTVSASFGKRIVIGRINASNGASALLSLLDMGLPGFLVASGVIGVLTQRLVHRLCEHCRQSYTPSDAIFGELGVKPRPDLVFYSPKGCDKCGNTGFVGSMGIFELFVPNEKVQEMVISRASAREIYQAAAETGLIPLRHDGIRKVGQGLTTLEEMLARL